MTRLTVRYNCGCGYSTSSLEEAIGHSSSFGHTLSATGEIRHEKLRPTTGTLLGIPMSDFDALRARLLNK